MSFAQVATKYFGTFGTTNYNGKRVGVIAVKIASDPAINQSFGGLARKEEVRNLKHQATAAKLAALSSSGSRGAPSFSPMGPSFY